MWWFLLLLGLSTLYLRHLCSTGILYLLKLCFEFFFLKFVKTRLAISDRLSQLTFEGESRYSFMSVFSMFFLCGRMSHIQWENLQTVVISPVRWQLNASQPPEFSSDALHTRLEPTSMVEKNLRSAYVELLVLYDSLAELCLGESMISGTWRLWVVAVNKSTKFLRIIFEPATQSAGVNIVTRSSVSSELSVCFISNICSMYTYLYMVHSTVYVKTL